MKKFFRNPSNKVRCSMSAVSGKMSDCKGDLEVNTIGGIIIAVVLIGLLIVAINAFFPNFFTTMFGSMRTKLTDLW